MPAHNPWNDSFCLDQVHTAAAEYRKTPEARTVAAQLGTIENLIEYVRTLPYRPDLGDPDDGPRIQCDVSQRLRLSPALLKTGRNCLEGTALFLALAPLIAPPRAFSSATVCVDGQMHTAPIEIVNGRPVAINIDAYEAVPANIRNGALYATGKASPLTGGHLAGWFNDLARYACTYRNAGPMFVLGKDGLCRALITGHPVENPDELEYLMTAAAEDAHLYGTFGQVGYQNMARSMRNLSNALADKAVSAYINKMMGSGQPMAGDILKAALVAQFGPAAAFALHGRKVGLSGLKDKTKKKITIGQGVQAITKRKPTREECRQLARRMSPAYFLRSK